MAEELVGRIVWRLKVEDAEPVPPPRDCRGLEGRIVHAQTAETAQTLLSAAEAVRIATRPARGITRTEADTYTLEAVETLGDLNPHFAFGPGRKLGL